MITRRWYRSAVLAVLLTALQACAGLGLQPAKTFADNYAYAVSQTTAIRSAATTALVSQQITRADAQYVLKLTDESRQLIDAALVLKQTGEATKAATQLELATKILTQLQSYLNARASR